MTMDEKRILRNRKNIKRDKYEISNCGGFELIYPSRDVTLMDKYEKFLEGSVQLTNEHAGTVKKVSSSIRVTEETISTVATNSNISTCRGLPQSSTDQLRRKGIQSTIDGVPRRTMNGQIQNFMRQTRQGQK